LKQFGRIGEDEDFTSYLAGCASKGTMNKKSKLTT